MVAILVAEENQTIDIESVKNVTGNSLAKFKQPKTYLVVDQLPRNTMGKVQKNILRESVKNSFT